MTENNLTYEQELIHRFGMDEKEANENIKKASKIYRELTDMTYHERLKGKIWSYSRVVGETYGNSSRPREKHLHSLGANGELEKVSRKKTHLLRDSENQP
ncbi:hypothetical protein CEXT_204941 [Caerostris extrusa]|uniref:Uncharacterized protein n=1 Tax=Caerostris extrusa TaxID=172846 RepID=A0AAV4WIZ3_CAEEX|nr:hypothetical protein CEXT_204941 [Caerostris extrusa]